MATFAALITICRPPPSLSNGESNGVGDSRITGHPTTTGVQDVTRWVGERGGGEKRPFGFSTLVTLRRGPGKAGRRGATGESEMGTTFAGKYPLDDADADATGVLPESTPPRVIRFFFFFSFLSLSLLLPISYRVRNCLGPFFFLLLFLRLPSAAVVNK